MKHVEPQQRWTSEGTCINETQITVTLVSNTRLSGADGSRSRLLSHWPGKRVILSCFTEFQITVTLVSNTRLSGADSRVCY